MRGTSAGRITTACTRQGAKVRPLRGRSLRGALQVKPGVLRSQGYATNGPTDLWLGLGESSSCEAGPSRAEAQHRSRGRGGWAISPGNCPDHRPPGGEAVNLGPMANRGSRGGVSKGLMRSALRSRVVGGAVISLGQTTMCASEASPHQQARSPRMAAGTPDSPNASRLLQ